MIQETLPTDKPSLRQWAIQHRQSLDMVPLSILLRNRLRTLPDVQNAQHILIYAAMPQEVDILPLADDSHRHWYLPRCAPGRRLAIHPYIPDITPFRTGTLGIREPDPKLVPEVEPTVLDVVIVPALLLTPEGGRLGYGGGYYDRFLPQIRPDARKIGVLPAALVVPYLPLNPWDVPLDSIVTESLP